MSKLTLKMKQSQKIYIRTNLMAQKSKMTSLKMKQRKEKKMGRVPPPTSSPKSKKKRQIMVQSMVLQSTLIS
jgi:hypothetical protein